MGTSIQYDLGYIQAAIEELQPYLLSDELYWSLSGHASPGDKAYPKLTLGGLLLALARSRARADSPKITGKADRLENRLETIRSQWQVAWDEKASWEFRSRLRQWGNYLNEVQRDPQEHAVYYPYEVSARVILELLKQQTEKLADSDVETLIKLDQRLRAQFITGSFMWDDDLSGGFPKDEFWFLWGRLTLPNNYY
ncbi:MAG: hypothetical protein ISS57_12080 [Anaerolineales bacterium]|nr:hypothetical protein [Anaerolineales bacterium]